MGWKRTTWFLGNSLSLSRYLSIYLSCFNCVSEPEQPTYIHHHHTTTLAHIPTHLISPYLLLYPTAISTLVYNFTHFHSFDHSFSFFFLFVTTTFFSSSRSRSSYIYLAPLTPTSTPHFVRSRARSLSFIIITLRYSLAW